MEIEDNFPTEHQWHVDPVTGEKIIPIAEEQLRIEKQVIDTGKVKITKSIKTENVKVELPFAQEEIDIERIAKNQYVEAPPSVRYEGDTTIIPVFKEVVVVEKKLLLTEEIRVTKKRKEGKTQQLVSLRKQVINVEHIPNRPDDHQDNH